MEDPVSEGVRLLLQRHNQAGRPIEPVTDLAADLNIDSVAAMDLVMEIEERFGVDIPINLLPDVVTAGDLEDLVRRQIAGRSGAA